MVPIESDLRAEGYKVNVAFAMFGSVAGGRRQYRGQQPIKRPQARQDQPQVVASTAHLSMQRVSQFAFEPVPVF